MCINEIGNWIMQILLQVNHRLNDYLVIMIKPIENKLFNIFAFNLMKENKKKTETTYLLTDSAAAAKHWHWVGQSAGSFRCCF
jgi:hypothetical protein